MAHSVVELTIVLANLASDERRADSCASLPSTWVPTVLGMTLQRLEWRHSGEDGRTGPEVTGKTCPAGLTSRRRPRQ
jgi:hypothetical protein